jgi:hypothetical protein
MIFNIICIALIGGIAYYHYAQGFFSATISAVLAVLAAVLAVAYQENIANSLFQTNVPDYANAFALIGIFAIVYIVLRTLTDKTIPGNLRLPVVVDRVGGGAMGVIAGLFTVGVFALAAQSLPFGPTIGGFSRYPVEDRPEVNVPPDSQHNTARNVDIYAQMSDDSFVPENRKALWIPADDLLLATVSKLSDGGSMAGQRTLTSIHPDYPTELFGQRLGIQIGAKRVALNLGKEDQVTVPAAFLVTADLTKNQVDDALPEVHERPVQAKRGLNQVQLVLRVIFHKDAKDTDPYVRVSTGAIRLVASASGKDYYPVGTLENGNTLFTNKPDDFLLIDLSKQDSGADFVFFVDPSDVLVGGSAAASGGTSAAHSTAAGGRSAAAPGAGGTMKIADGVFVEVKRRARVDLSGMDVKVGVTPAANVKVERKPYVLKHAGIAAGGAGAQGESAGEQSAVESAAGFVYSGVEISNNLFSPISTGSAGTDARNQQMAGGTFSLQSSQFTQLDIEPTRSLTLMAQGPAPIHELFVPPGKKLVQVKGSPPPEGGEPWSWGQLSKWQLIDAAKKTYAPAGAFAKVKKQQTDMMVASYNATAAPKDISGQDGRPTDVWIAFLVPSGTHLKELTFNGKPVTPLDQQVP